MSEIDHVADLGLVPVGFEGDEYVVELAIEPRHINIGGIVHGNIIATEKLEMLSTGKVYGNVTTSRLKIADGVVFEGKCEMIKDPEDVDIFSSSVSKIKSTLQTV